MLFNSLAFLLFFPCVVLIYYIIPQKAKNTWLLICSYVFYMGWNVKYAVLLLGCTIVSYFGAILMGKAKARKGLVLVICLLMVFGVLFLFKYLNFFIENIESLINLINPETLLPRSHWLLPVGISFYVFQTAGYLIDIYRGDTDVEKNFIKYALFVSFFPQLVAGPIERSKNILGQLKENHKFDFDIVKDGFFLMLWGYFLKIVVADRAAIFVDSVYAQNETTGGAAIVIATMFFALQIYCDFYGYSTIATGAAKVLGINLMENFDAPYLSVTVKDFWKRWHISLTSWFRDYIYFPLGGSRCSKARNYFNLLFVFLISGIWHGANWSFVIWGVLNGLYQVVGDMTKGVRGKMCRAFRVNTETDCIKVARMIVTFILVDFSWLFFRASGTNEAFYLVNQIFTNFKLENIWGKNIYNFGLNEANIRLLLFSVLIILIADMFKRRRICIRQWIYRQNALFQIVFVALVVVWIVSRGIWGRNYDIAGFIYFQF